MILTILKKDDNYKKSLAEIFKLCNIELQNQPSAKFYGFNVDTYSVVDVKNRILDIAIENIISYDKLNKKDGKSLSELFYKIFISFDLSTTKEEDFYYDFIISFYNNFKRL